MKIPLRLQSIVAVLINGKITEEPQGKQQSTQSGRNGELLPLHYKSIFVQSTVDVLSCFYDLLLYFLDQGLFQGIPLIQE